jgi:hypothetical protein
MKFAGDKRLHKILTIIGPAIVAFFSKLIKNKKVNILFRIVITVFFFLLVNKSISQADLKQLLNTIDPLVIMTVLLSGIIGFYLQVIRWKYILQARHLPCKGCIPLKTMLWGNLLGFLTPGRVGELFRGIGIDPARKSDSVVAVLIDRLLAIVIVVSTGVLFMIIQTAFLKISPPLIEIISFGILIALVVISIVIINVSYFKSKKTVSKARSLFSGILHLLNMKIVFISILAHLFLILQTVLLFQMFGSPGWIFNSVTAGQSYLQMIFLPFSIANVGIREYSFGLFLKQTIANEESEMIAFGVSSLILFINIILPAFIGLIWIIFDKNNKIRVSGK